MPLADNTHHLLAAAKRRSETTRRRALEAIASLASSGNTVTPTKVALAAGVSRQWLYTCPEVRKALETAAAVGPVRPSSVPSPQRSSVASMQRRIEALTDDNRRLRERVAELEQRLAIVYGELRARAT